MEKILLQNGMIIDGTGRKRFKGHVLMEDGVILDVVPAGDAPPEADRFVEAEGLAVCPGFIDMHSHMDWVLCLEDNPHLLKSHVEQGITTVVAGNCGFSPAPFKGETFFSFQQHTPLLVRLPDFTWESMGGFLDRVDEIGPCLNMAELVGHAVIRFAGAKTLRGRTTEGESRQCLDLLARSLDQGACGLSFGLGYEPGMYSPLSEIEDFCSVAREKDKPVTVHLKALSAVSPTYPVTTMEPHNLKALKEMLDVARATGIRLQISHLLFAGRNSFWTAEKTLSLIEKARNDGVDVMFDAYPFTCGNTTIAVLLPHWFLRESMSAYRSRWLKMRLRVELTAGFKIVGFTYDDFQIMDCAMPGQEEINGMRVSEIAKKWGMRPFDALLSLCEGSRGGALTLFHGYSGEPGREEALEAVLSHDLCLFETDALIKEQGYPNPAAMGTFPRIVGPLARERKLFTLEKAVAKSTLQSAQRFGIRDRGEIAKGKAADIVVFDPDSVSDTPPAGAIPAGKPKGIRHVFINGTCVVRDGSALPGVRAGRVLRN